MQDMVINLAWYAVEGIALKKKKKNIYIYMFIRMRKFSVIVISN